MKHYKILLFLTAISQLFSTYFTKFTGGSNFNELLITPAGYTFAIWGLITAFTSIHAFWHLFFGKNTFQKKQYLLLSLVYICFTLWLLAAERAWLLATLIIFAVMYLALLKVFPVVIERKNNFMDNVFLQGGVGAYIGWTSVAFVANIGVYLFSFGIENYSTLGITLQIALIILAALSAGFVLKKTFFNKAVFATHWWAFIGILVGLFSKDNTTILIVTTLVAVLLLNIYAYGKKIY